MSQHFNPFPTNFIDTLNSGIYVDKTDLIIHLNELINTNKKYICVSRPRRFGKSVTADMLVAYYRHISDEQKKRKKESVNQETIFNNKILTKYKDWNKYVGKFDVIKLDMSKIYSSGKTIDKGFLAIAKKLKNEIKKNIPDFDFEYENENDLAEDIVYSVFYELYSKTDREIVLIIDEWDFIMRDKNYIDNDEAQERYSKFLTSLIKGQEYIALAYMTGILPIKKYGNQSSIGFFEEYSMTSPQWMAKYVGFTEDEVEALWNEFQNNYNNQNSSNKKLKLNNEELNDNKFKENKVKELEFNFENIKNWYDGYILRDNNKNEYNIYTPLSIANSFINKNIKSYWNKTETFKALSYYINSNYDGLKEDIVILMRNNKLEIDIKSYENDKASFKIKDDVLTMLVHLGYLGYIEETQEAFIPNNELMDEFEHCIKYESETKKWENSFATLERSENLLKATWACNEGKVAKLIEEAHDFADNKTYNNEVALRYAIQLAYYKSIDYYTLFPEVDSGRGYADLIYIPKPNCNKPALVVELKYEKDVKAAIYQIKKQNYPKNLGHYKNNLLLVEINYDKDIKSTSPLYKHHTCKIEKYNEEEYLKEEERKRKEIEEIEKKKRANELQKQERREEEEILKIN